MACEPRTGSASGPDGGGDLARKCCTYLERDRAGPVMHHLPTAIPGQGPFPSKIANARHFLSNPCSENQAIHC